MTWLLVETQMHTAQASKHPWTHTHTCFLWEVSKTLIHVREAHWDNVYSIGLWYIKNISLFHFHSYWAMITFALSCLITTSKCMSVCQKLRCWPADSAIRLGQSLLRVTGADRDRGKNIRARAPAFSLNITSKDCMSSHLGPGILWTHDYWWL